MKRLLFIVLIPAIFIHIISSEYVLLQTLNYGTIGDQYYSGPHITDFNRNGIDEMMLNCARTGEPVTRFYEYDPIYDSMEFIFELNRGYYLWAGDWGDYDNDNLYEIVGFSPDSHYHFTMEQADSLGFPDSINWTETADHTGGIFSTNKLKPDSLDRIVRTGVILSMSSDLAWGYYTCDSIDYYTLKDTFRLLNTITYLDFVDFDNDTLLDLLLRTGSGDSALIIEEAVSSSNDSFVPYKAYPIVDESPRPSKIVVLPDIDKDGEKEIGFTKTGFINPNPEYYFCIAEDTNGTGELVDILNEKIIVETNNILFTGTGVDCADVDSDGEVEVVFSGGRHMEVWGCIGDNTFEKEYEFTDPGMNLLLSTVLCHDFNQNGIPEIIFTGSKGDDRRTYIIECRPIAKLSYDNPYTFGNKPLSIVVIDSLYLKTIDELPVIIDSMKLLKQRNITLNEPSYPCSVPSYDSLPITFDIYSDTSTFITDTLIVYSNDWYGNIDTIELNAGIGAQIVIDSAIASDNRNAQAGVDYDDYVRLYFNYPIDTPDTSTLNLDSILPLSNNHTWYDGTGNIKQINYTQNNTVMTIWLSTNTSIPTVLVGDSIYPDTSGIQDERFYSYLSNPVEITGSFDPAGIKDNKNNQESVVITTTFNTIQIQNNTNTIQTYQIMDITGRMIDNITAKQGLNTYTPKQSGIYFVINNSNHTIDKAIIIK